MNAELRALKSLCVATVFAASLPVSGQSVIVFANLAPGVNAPFFDTTGTNRLAGDGFRASLFVGPAGASEESLADLVISAPFQTGGAAGYWVSTRIPLPFTPGSAFEAQVRFWDTQGGTHNSFGQALAAGADTGVSTILNLTVNTIGDTVLTGLKPAGLIPQTPAVSPSVPFTRADAMAVANGSQPGTLCDTSVGRTRWLLARFAVPGEAAIAVTPASAIISVHRRCPNTPTGCELVACSGADVDGQIPIGQIPIGQTLISPDPTRTFARFEADTNETYAVAVSRLEDDPGPIVATIFIPIRLTVSPLPGHRVELSWPSDAGPYALESTVSPDPASTWTVETNQPVLSGGRLTVRQDAQGQLRLFRLRYPLP